MHSVLLPVACLKRKEYKSIRKQGTFGSPGSSAA
jgi:hypothetical protein